MKKIQLVNSQTKNLYVTILFSLFLSLTAYAQEVGVELYTFREQIPKDVPGMLQKISAMGIRVVEGGGTYGLTKEEFKQLLDKNNLKMVSFSADFGELEKDPQEVADRAKFFGAEDVVCFWIPHNDTIFTIEDAKKAADVFNKAGKIFKDNGLSFLYHAHGYEFQKYEQGTFFDYMIKNFDSAYVNIQMDVFWFKNSGQDPVEWLNKHPNRFKSLHLKDRKHGTENNVTGDTDVETNVTLGKGDVDIAGIMRAAKKIGIKYAFIEDESSRSLEQVPESLAYLKTLQ
jgi:sugar phosphate isomerase/epimerase